MRLVERHIVKKADEHYRAIDDAAFKAKNLYNAANYQVRQALIYDGDYLNYYAVYTAMKEHECYLALPRKVAQQVLMRLHQNWMAFFAACRACKEHPEQFLGRPGLPHYLDKEHGRAALVYTQQALSKPALQRGLILPSGLPIVIETKKTAIAQVRIVPRAGFYVVEVVYDQAEIQADVSPDLYGALDIGVDNLAALTSNKEGFVPRLVNGRPLKSVNQFYNKRKAHLQRCLPGHRYSSNRIERMTTTRTRRVDHYLHTISRRIVNLLVTQRIGVLVIGKNLNWKQQVHIGKRNNQQFVCIPHARFIDMLTYKAQLVGIRVILTEESYTSKCSFLDHESIGKHEHYLGKRITRGLFRASDGRTINADVNGSYNILRKVLPDAFGQGDSGCVVQPVPFVTARISA